MQRRYRIAATIGLSIFLWTCRATHADTVYDLEPYLVFNDVNWGLSGGSITTDGSLGEITSTNIVDWSIDYFSNERVFTLSPGNSSMLFFNDAANGLTATATELLMVGADDLPGNNEQLLFLEPTPSFEYGMGYFASEPSDVGGISLFDSETSPTSSSMLVFGGDTFLIGTAIPEPQASLFLSCFLLLMATRRRVKPVTMASH